MKSNLKFLGLPLVAAVLMGVMGCQSRGDGDRTAGRVLDDRAVTGRVEKSLADAPVYKFEDVKVSTYRGVVQLSGWVATEEQRSVAERVAREVPGIREVVNNITVKAPGDQPGRTSQVQPQ